MTQTFLSLGECMVELAPAGEGLFRMGFAGDTFNTAYYARKLLADDWRVAYGTCVGDDAVSDDMLAMMRGYGIDTGTIRRLHDRTVGLYTIQLKDGERSFSYWRGQSAAKTLADDPAWLAGVLAEADVIFISGITLAILSPDARRRLCAGLQKAREGRMTVFDTNLRPRLWRDEAEMRAGMTLGARASDVVLPSFDEEQSLYGDITPEDTIARYRELGAKLVVVKNGPAALHVWSAETGEHVFHPEPVAQVVDTTAAGDSFDAGFLSVHLTGGSLENAVRRGMTVAARVVSQRGALVELEED